MEHFFEQSISAKAEFEDDGYSSYDSQLRWRLDDLNDRYSELYEQNAPYCGEDHYTDDDYRYAPVEYFETLVDVARAIEIVKADFKETNGNAEDIFNDTTELETADVKVMTHGIVNSLIRRLEVLKGKTIKGKERVKLDAYFTPVDLIGVLDEKERLEMRGEYRGGRSA